ncbi:hypothetical protein MPNT_40071 [Candidatus Methylacidithermus pantelleriae]|uniref:Uncharacterized protein n=1 Tax=Candidatus Methylacidithermus pantelleriae TaxID=2744239 RepID=A0A8J2BRA2_9BACT|nr:hypothetical protein MPNT_40071 [Candidatus Methylacidithermus pantelleriae]
MCHRPEPLFFASLYAGYLGLARVYWSAGIRCEPACLVQERGRVVVVGSLPGGAAQICPGGVATGPQALARVGGACIVHNG